MGTSTPKRSLYKPTPITETSGWGDNVNTNFDILDEVILHSNFSQAEGFLRKTGVDTYEAIKSNLNASTNPTANEDSGDGYAVGSVWINTTADRIYVCLDATLGAAIWSYLNELDTVAVEEDDVSVQGAASILNFTGTLSVTDNGGGQVTISGQAGAGMSQLSDDTSPSLGGDLDAAGFGILDSVDNAVEFQNAAYFGEPALTDGANIAWNVGTMPSAKVTLGGNRQLDNPTNMKAGATYILRVITGGYDLTYGTAYLWPSGVAPVLTSGIDILSFYSDGINMYGAFLGDFS